MRREEVEEGLKRLVENAKGEIPLLSEVRVYGSYNNGGWDLRESDIDIFVEIDDESSSFISFVGNKNYESVRNLRRKLKRGLKQLGLFERVNIDILNKSDVVELWEVEYIPGKGSYGQNVKNGRLLYPTNLPLVFW